MAKSGKWTLADLLDFEWLLETDKNRSAAVDRRLFQESGKELIQGVKDRTEQRRIGLLAWLKGRQEQGASGPGDKLVSGLSFATIGLCVVMFISGVSIIVGLLKPGNLYNIGHFLLITLGLQWLILLAALVLFFVRRKATDGMSLAGQALFSLVRRFSPQASSQAWSALARQGGRYKDVGVWTLAKMGQSAGVCFNFGLIIGLIGVFWFQDVRFFWETTHSDEPEAKWEKVVNAIAVPFIWTASSPDREEIAAARLRAGSDVAALSADQGKWPRFMLLSLIFWGLIPRLLLWLYSIRGRKRALAFIDFQGPKHRELWRRMSYVERIVETEGQADEVVLIDCGGTGIELADVSQFLRARLRVYPTSLQQLGVIDREKEKAAIEALKSAKAGVILLAEGWDLSPKLMKGIHDQVRAVLGKDQSIWVVVVGVDVTAPDQEEMKNWKNFVDQLEDSATEVVPYELTEHSLEKSESL